MTAKESGYPFTLTWIIYATPAEVYTALSDAEKIKTWSGEDAIFNAEVNGEYEMFGGWVKGKVLAAEPEKKLSFSWKPKEWSPKTMPSLVTCLLEADPAGTRLTLIHSDFPGLEESESHKSGWVDNVFEPLNDYFVMR